MEEQALTQVELTHLLNNWSEGDHEALDKILPYVYDDLYRKAKYYFQSESPNHDLQPTALVNEAVLKLTHHPLENLSWESRAHFINLVGRLMRQVLVDCARRQNALKRPQVVASDTRGVEDARGSTRLDPDEMLALDLALDKLAELDPRQYKIVQCKFFLNMTNQEVAEALGMGERQVRRDWNMAKAWLRHVTIQPKA